MAGGGGGGGGGRGGEWRRITVGPGTRHGHEYFRSQKARAVVTQNQRKTVLICAIVR